MTKIHTPPLLKVTQVRLSPIFIGIAVSILCVLVLTVVFLIEEIPLTWYNYTRTAYFTFVFGYVVYITRIIQNTHQRNFESLLSIAQLTTEEKAGWKSKMANHRRQRIEMGAAFLVGGLHAYFGILSNVFFGDSRFPVYDTWRGIQVILVWMLITQAATIFMSNMTLLNKLSRHTEVDLLNMDKLMPLTQSGIVSILAFIGSYSLLLIQGINVSSLNNPAMLLLVPTIIWMMVTPLKGIRKRIIDAKHKEIERIDAAIEGDMEALKSSRIKNNLENINVIDLINYKKTIQNTLEIPVNIPTASRFLFYLIIPMLTWIAASIVDKVIDYLIK